MSLTLGMIVKNEAFYTSIILPLIRRAFDEIVAVDAESTDGTPDVLRANGATVISKPWTGYSDARNAVIRHTKTDWLIQLDGDEAMFPDDLQLLRNIMADRAYNSIIVPKYEFSIDHDHHQPYWYPDLKKRIFRMGVGYYYHGKLHEQLTRPGETKEEQRCVPEVHMYHYGQSKPAEVVWLRHENYRRLEAGEPLLTEIPAGFKAPRQAGVPFLRNHPLKGIPPARSLEEYRRARP
jgi:glycosyltransferase involved in cell wall biosynthesis